MLVSELREKVSQHQASDNLVQQTVEFVFKDQKYFLQKDQSSASKLEMVVSRQAYQALPLKKFLQALESAPAGQKASFLLADNNASLQAVSTFVNTEFLEISLEAL